MPVQPTWIRWYNDADGAKIACVAGSYEDLEYGSVSDREFHAAGKPPHPENGQFQWGIACSRTSRTIVADIDKPEEWVQGNVFVELGDWPDICTSYRDDMERAHVVIEVPEELLHLWPRQGPTLWGDVKSNGFSYIEGTHYSGKQYVGTGRPWIVANPDLMNALTADRIFPQGHGSTGTPAGPWEDDEYRITSHDECVNTVYAMVEDGLSHEEIVARLEVIMPNREDAWPVRTAYIDEKIRSAERKVAAREQAQKEFWGLFHPGGYDGLAAAVRQRQIENIARANPAGIQQDTTEWIEHQIARGADLRRYPLADRLNPMRRPIEPGGTYDKSNALDILEAAMPHIRFASDEGCWLVNTGINWETWATKSDKHEVARSVVSAYGTYLKTESQLAEELNAQGTAQSEEQIAEDDARRERLVKSRMKFMNSQGQGSIATSLITEARTTDRYSVLIGELDSEPDVLWAGGYPWSLRHPELTLASDVKFVNPVHLKTAACAPAPGDTPAFDQVLEAVWPDPEVRAWALREIAGVTLWGATSKRHPVLDGPPQGGKSTFALILVTILGSYAVQVSPDKILGNDTSSAHEEEVAAMIGARCVWMDEPPPGGKQSISRFNDLASGTGKLSAARKYQNRITAPKLFNFLICQNPRNGLRMDAQGVGERMTFIPCTGQPEVTKAAWERWKLEGEKEYAAVLAKLIRECALFHTGARLPEPLGAQFGRAEAQERADEFGTWLLENYDILPDTTPTVDKSLDNSPTIGSLRTLYNDVYARPNKTPVVSAPEARDQLERLGVKVGTGGTRRRKHVTWLEAKPLAMGIGLR